MKALAFEIGSILVLSLASDKDVIVVTLHLKAATATLPKVISFWAVFVDADAPSPIRVTFWCSKPLPPAREAFILFPINTLLVEVEAPVPPVPLKITPGASPIHILRVATVSLPAPELALNVQFFPNTILCWLSSWNRFLYPII